MQTGAGGCLTNQRGPGILLIGSKADRPLGMGENGSHIAGPAGSPILRLRVPPSCHSLSKWSPHQRATLAKLQPAPHAPGGQGTLHKAAAGFSGDWEASTQEGYGWRQEQGGRCTPWPNMPVVLTDWGWQPPLQAIGSCPLEPPFQPALGIRQASWKDQPSPTDSLYDLVIACGQGQRTLQTAQPGSTQ